jgi:hypothetical protein
MSTTLIPLGTRVEPEVHAEVIEFRRRKPDIPPLAAVVRELIELGLRTAQRREKQHQTTS